ncbi:MAG TPA: peptide chain release factor N(5)-glutamine methyltransferase, partial [Thermoanaerobaculia bacterium]|nr:peptide chain release factor N(5)-glutamine methyltransferase [Thermoanaerobaculia bacterium]
RAAGEPVAYLLGEREFYGRPFSVDHRVLVPRPETELLVETALALPLPARPRLLDIGTGSGCLAVTLARELPEARVTATDRSSAALAVARRNCRRHAVAERVRLVGADLAAGLAISRFDLVVTNPPYVDPGERDGLPATVRDFEPPEALFAPGHGLSVWLRLLDEVGPEMAPGAWLAGEIGQGQLPALAGAAESSPLAFERAVDDLAGIPRVVILRRRA